MLEPLYSAPLRLLSAVVRFFGNIRRRVKAFLARPLPALITRVAVIVTAVLWLLVFLFSDGRQGRELDQWFEGLRQTTGYGFSLTDGPVAGAGPER